MNESFVTVCGNLVADPQGRSTKSGKPFASFRVASTSRRWDVESGRFVDGSTNFVNVVGFNALGANIMGSLSKGDPVVVYGRLRVNQYVGADGKNMTSIEIDAHGVGHDLTRGQSAFQRATRPQYDNQDRMADANILESFDAFEGLSEETESFLAAETAGPAVPAAGDEGALPDRHPGLLVEEDADLDPYVVTSS